MHTSISSQRYDLNYLFFQKKKKIIIFQPSSSKSTFSKKKGKNEWTTGEDSCARHALRRMARERMRDYEDRWWPPPSRLIEIHVYPRPRLTYLSPESLPRSLLTGAGIKRRAAAGGSYLSSPPDKFRRGTAD